MKLIQFRVQTYKTIEDTGWISIDDLCCLVGENEAGKTNVLLALLKLNPADDEIGINLLSDYPRSKYTEEKDIAGNKKFIEAIFEFDELHSVSYSKADDENDDAEKTVKKFKYTKVERYYNGEYKVFVFNELDGDEEKYEELINSKESVIDKIPRFVYYSSYANLNAEIYLPHVIDNQARKDMSEKEKIKAKTLKLLFRFVNLEPNEILELGKEQTLPSQPKTEQQIEKEAKNKNERDVLLSSASTNITKKFQNWWKQGNYNFRFSADGNYFKIYVSDSVRKDEIELENRSAGLQWFFSFYLTFIAEATEEHTNSIILLDEPGHTLHPMAQQDLSLFFNELALTNQLIYTTHSPFLVDSANITKTKAVYFDENGITKLSDDLKIKRESAKKSIYPINSAIGITVSESMLIGCKPIIVEGISDQIYLAHIKRKLLKKGKLNSKEELIFMPVDGTKNIKPVVSIITGRDDELPFVIVDNDESGKEKEKSLKKNMYATEQGKIVNINGFLLKETNDAEIEDFMDISKIVECFNREFRFEEDFSYSEKSKDSIVKQIENFVTENSYNLPLGWKVQIAKRYINKNEDPSEELLKKWEELFKIIK